MDIVTAIRALNQRAVQENWHHFIDPTLAFGDDSGHQQLLNLWREKSGDKPMPRRSQITPRDLKDFLRNVLLFEREAQNPSRFRWRLIGTSLTSILGEHTGKTFDESIPTQHMARWQQCGDLILNGGQPLRFLGRVHMNGREFLNAENLFVPLANDQDEPAFILGQCRYTPRTTDDGDVWENQIASLPGGLL